MKAFRVLGSGRVYNTLCEAREALKTSKGFDAIERVYIYNGRVEWFCIVEDNGGRKWTVKKADQAIEKLRREGHPELLQTFVHRDTWEYFGSMREALMACRGRGTIFMEVRGYRGSGFWDQVPMMIDGKVIRTTREATEVAKSLYDKYLNIKSKIKTV